MDRESVSAPGDPSGSGETTELFIFEDKPADCDRMIELRDYPHPILLISYF
jgi:hypothetical protein